MGALFRHFFGAFEFDGITVTTQVDDVTGLSSTVVLDSKQRGGKDLRPTIKLVNAKAADVYRYMNFDQIPEFVEQAAANSRRSSRGASAIRSS